MKKVFNNKVLHIIIPLSLILLILPSRVLANEGSTENHTAVIAETFLWLAIIFIVSKFGTIVERIGQPSVLGEIIVGVILGNLGLIGIHWIDNASNNDYLKFLAEFGVVLLLFRIGLESNIHEMKKVGLMAFLVATVGVIVPFVLGTFVVGNWLFNDSSFTTKLFIGAALTATSVGITARVFQDLGKLQTKEAKVVLGAAVIDDVMGLLILAVVSSIAKSGSLDIETVAILSAKALGFLIASIVFGQISAKYIGTALSKIHSGVGMKLTFAIAFALIFAYLASLVGLAPIVGAFAAGLVLDAVHFKGFNSSSLINSLKVKVQGLGEKGKEIAKELDEHHEKHVEDLVDTIGHLFIPLFFVITGLQVKLDVLFDPKVLAIALAVTAVAFAGKIVAGLATWGGTKKMIVGFGMIPRGEVGLIFANVGKGLGVVSDELFSVIVVMVILSTLLTPPVLTFMLKRK